MRDIPRIFRYVLVRSRNPPHYLLISLRIGAQRQHWVITELSQVLKRLEDVLLRCCSWSFHVRVLLVRFVHERLDRFVTRFGSLKVVVQALLDPAEIAIVILNDLWGQVLQHILLHSSQDKRQDLFMQRLECENGCRGKCTSARRISSAVDPTRLTAFLLLGCGFGILVGKNGARETFGKLLLRAQEPGHQKVEQTPKLENVVLNWRAR